jgi:hypothetical protein
MLDTIINSFVVCGNQRSLWAFAQSSNPSPAVKKHFNRNVCSRSGDATALKKADGNPFNSHAPDCNQFSRKFLFKMPPLLEKLEILPFGRLTDFTVID